MSEIDRPIQILVVEDAIENLRGIYRELAKAGFHTYTGLHALIEGEPTILSRKGVAVGLIGNHVVAQELIEQHKPHTLYMDAELGVDAALDGVNGVDISIKALRNNHTQGVVCITGSKPEDMASRIREALAPQDVNVRAVAAMPNSNGFGGKKSPPAIAESISKTVERLAAELRAPVRGPDAMPSGSVAKAQFH
ncbi:MAG TPA: hypothetical protein VFR09_08160 [Alphaproteobacteria bacterium]|nr:hypothetical protein [Alphaproteobacteria bacterium]